MRGTVLLSVMLGAASQKADSAKLESPLPQPNPPNWPSSVKVFGPSDDPQDILRELAKAQEQLNDRAAGHFSSERLALLFKPGRYDFDVKVGYYTQVLGLGAAADEVVFGGRRGVHVTAMDTRPGGAGSLDTFWRSAENFKSEASEGMMWAVSQAAPLRRVHVAGNLSLHDGAFYASGGFAAGLQVDGKLSMGPQQQWMMRNSNLNESFANEVGGAWSFVYVGCPGAPESSPGGSGVWPAKGGPAVHSVARTPLVAEKPFVAWKAQQESGGSGSGGGDGEGRFELRVPAFKVDSSGAELGASEAMAKVVPFERVFLADPLEHAHQDIQSALDSGLDVVLGAGIFDLGKPLVLATRGQVLLGIGMATLVAPRDGSPCLRVEKGVEEVRVAGLMLQAAEQEAEQGAEQETEQRAEQGAEQGAGQAGEAATQTAKRRKKTASAAAAKKRSALLVWEEGADLLSGAPTGLLADVFARVGGPDLNRERIAVDTMVRLEASGVVGDNLWLWRADHSQLAPGEPPKTYDTTQDGRADEVYHLVAEGEYECGTGLEVTGADVTVYGLAVEHAMRDQTVWLGERGRVFFYQCELPYDASQSSFGAGGFAGYVVGPQVRDHSAVGVGVYSFFRDHQASAKALYAASPQTNTPSFCPIPRPPHIYTHSPSDHTSPPPGSFETKPPRLRNK